MDAPLAVVDDGKVRAPVFVDCGHDAPWYAQLSKRETRSCATGFMPLGKGNGAVFVVDRPGWKASVRCSTSFLTVVVAAVVVVHERVTMRLERLRQRSVPLAADRLF